MHVHRIKKGEGELGLKFGPSEKYFGVINVGEPDEIIKELRDDPEFGIIIGEPDGHTESLFETIKSEQSSVHILIGAKKFMEGWSSYRVSTMGLLNVGKTEGSQIIQLFGRGVRLRGKKEGITHTLKRSSATEPVPPKYLPILETLNIFGVQASYMNDFHKFLEVENPPEIYIPFQIPIKPDLQLLGNNLVIPYIDKSGFKKERPLRLTFDTSHPISVEVDLMPRVQSLESPRIREERERNIHDENNLIPQEIPEEYLEALNWVHIYRDSWNLNASKSGTILFSPLTHSNHLSQQIPTPFGVQLTKSNL